MSRGDSARMLAEVWKRVSLDPLPDLMVTSEKRIFRSVRRWRGKRFCLRTTVWTEYMHAIRWNGT